MNDWKERYEREHQRCLSLQVHCQSLQERWDSAHRSMGSLRKILEGETKSEVRDAVVLLTCLMEKEGR